MANIQLPRARLTTPATPPVPANNGDLIMKVMGNNPYAQAIDQITPVLAQALQKRQELRNQARQVAALGQAAGDDAPPVAPGITPETYEKLLTIKGARTSKLASAAKDRTDLELKLEGLRRGYVETDPLTGAQKKFPGVTDLSIVNDANGNPIVQRGASYAPGEIPKSPGGGGSNNDPLKDLQNDIDPSNPRSGMAKQVERKNGAGRVLVLLDQANNDPNALQSREAAAAVASLIQGGSSGRIAQEQLDHLTPSSMKGDIMRQWGYLINAPVSLGQTEFFKSLRQTAEREQATVDSQIKATQVSRLGRHERTHHLFPEAYSTILGNMGLDASKVKNGRYVEDAPQAFPTQSGSPSASAGNEVKRVTKDGRTAIFDGGTKKFLRYE